MNDEQYIRDAHGVLVSLMTGDIVDINGQIETTMKVSRDMMIEQAKKLIDTPMDPIVLADARVYRARLQENEVFKAMLEDITHAVGVAVQYLQNVIVVSNPVPKDEDEE
jgi:hypothetical protein